MVIPALGDFLDSTQLVAQYWQAVGVDAQVQTVDRTLFYDRKDNNDQDASVFLGSGGMVEVRGTAEGTPFSRATLEALLDLATAGIAQITAAQHKALEA